MTTENMTTTEAATPLYLAVGKHAWGTGETIDAAKKECRKHGAHRERLSVYELPEGAVEVFVTGLGDCQWRRPGPDGPGKLTHVAGPDRREGK